MTVLQVAWQARASITTSIKMRFFIFNQYGLQDQIQISIKSHLFYLYSFACFQQKQVDLHSQLLINNFAYALYLIIIGMNEWELIESGPSFFGADIQFIKETLTSQIVGIQYEQQLTKKAQRISRILKLNIGKGEWQVVCVKGNHARKFVCSRNLFCIFQKKDGLKVYVWVNKFKSEQQSMQNPF